MTPNLRRSLVCCNKSEFGIFRAILNIEIVDEAEVKPVSSVVKKRRKKMAKHKHRKMLKKTRWQRRHG
jgi:hypothetical protein